MTGRPGGAIGLLRGGVAIETVLGAAALVAAAVLTTLSPPTAVDLEADTAVSIEAIGEDEAILGLLTMDSAPRLGTERRVDIDLAYAPSFPDDEGPVRNHTCGRDTCVTLRVIGQGGASSPLFLEPDGTGRWSTDVYWSEAGPHEVEVQVQTDSVFRDTLRFPVTVS